MRSQRGFTVIELLVVIAILGILAGVVVFAVGSDSNIQDQRSCLDSGGTPLFEGGYYSECYHGSGR